MRNVLVKNGENGEIVTKRFVFSSLMENLKPRYYDFGEFRFDARRRILQKNGEQIPLSSRICDLLIVLLQNEGRTIDHDELLDTVWEGTFVEQSNLKKSISALRQALGENPSENQYIKTIPRKGYCFVAPVKVEFDDNESGAFQPKIAAEEVKADNDTVQLEPQIVPQSVISPKKPARKLTFTYKAAIFGVLLMGLLAVAGWFAFSKRSVRFSVENTETQRLTTDGKYFDSGVSPDGNYLIHSTRENNDVSLILHQLATGSSNKLVSYPDASFWSYQFTPDGNFVYYIVKNWGEPEKTGIYKVPFLGGEAKLVYKSDGGGGLTFSPDGKQIAFQHGDKDKNPEIIIMSSDGTNARKAIGFEPSTRLWSLRFSPDGKSLLFVIRRENAELKNLFSVRSLDLATSKETYIIPEQERVIHSAVWMPAFDSILMLVREPNAEIRQIWQYFPGSGEWIRVTNDNDSYATINLLADGKSIVATRETTNSSIWAADGEPYNFRQVTGGVNQFGRTDWTADGRLAYLSVENRAEIISIMTPAGRNKQPLTTGNDGMWLQPSMSNDGNSILYISSQSGSQQVWKMGLDGAGKTMLTRSDAPIFDSKLLSDGKTLIFQKFTKPTGWKLFKQVGEEEAVPVLEQQISEWDISPDEKQIAVWIEDEATKKWSVVIADLATGQIVRTVEGIKQNMLRWTPDGKGLAYVNAADDIKEIRVKSLDDKTPERTITTVQFENIFWFDWSRDGNKLVVVRGQKLADAVSITLKKD